MNFLEPEAVLFIHARLIEETGGAHGLRDLGLLLSALDRPKASFSGEDLYPQLFDKAAALMDSLIRNHPFVDGNKRTAITGAAIFLSQNGYRLSAANEEVLDFTLACARSLLTLEQIKTWFEDHSVRT